MAPRCTSITAAHEDRKACRSPRYKAEEVADRNQKAGVDLDSTKLRDATAVASSHIDKNHDKSADEQLHEWYLWCGVNSDFKDPFACDLAVHDRLL